MTGVQTCALDLPEALEELAELTLLASYNRRIDDGSGAFGIYLELIDDPTDAVHGAFHIELTAVAGGVVVGGE